MFFFSYRISILISLRYSNSELELKFINIGSLENIEYEK